MSETWGQVPLEERVRRVCALRRVLVREVDQIIGIIRLPWRKTNSETIGGEITPLADACKFMEESAGRVLSPRRFGAWGRPAWLWGVAAETRREPLGRVLVIGPGNYPLMLAGIQIAQALVAGNEVLFKPAPGNAGIAQWLAAAWHGLGVPAETLIVLDENPASIEPHLSRVNKIVLTGSEASGRAILRRCAEHLIPAALELSGCDPVMVLPGADLDRTAECVRFGLEFNGSESCIAPRRVMVGESQAEELAEKLVRAVADIGPSPMAARTLDRINDLGGRAVAEGAVIRSGELPCPRAMRPLILDRVSPAMAVVQEDIMAPITSLIRVANEAEMLAAHQRCGYRLGASIFGSAEAARRFAGMIDAGCVVINDMMIPTADPRLPFGGHGRSGFGVTRGIEGLLEMTRTKTVSVRKGGAMFHLRPAEPSTADILRHQLTVRHGVGVGARGRALVKLIGAVRQAGRRKR